MMDASTITFYTILYAFTWYFCLKCSWRKIALKQTLLLNRENIAITFSMTTLGICLVLSTQSMNAYLLSWISIPVSFYIFRNVSTNPTDFWRKRRNIFLSLTSFIGFNLITTLWGVDPYVLAGVYLLFIIRKSQITLNFTYRQHIQDFSDIKEKLAFLESTLRNTQLTKKEASPSPNQSWKNAS